MNPILKVLAIAASIFLIGYFIGLSIEDAESLEHSIEVLAELFTVFVSFSIFAVTWYAYNRSKDNHALFLGATFFVIGFLDLFHTLSYPFMPEFITPNSPQKSAIFWSFARFASAPLLAISVLIYKDTLPRWINKPVLFALVIIPNSILAFFVLYYHDYLPIMEYPDGSSSIPRILGLTVSIVVILYSGYLYTNRIQKTGERNLNYITHGFIIVVLSDIVYFSYEIPGHLLKIAGFYLIYFALYKSSVEMPYERLAIAEEKLRQAAEDRYRNLFDNANDAIIITDIEDRITSWNKSAETIFGWTAQEAIGKKFSELIVPGNLRHERQNIISAVLSGKTVSGVETVRLRKDGARIYVSPTVSPIRDKEQKIIGLSHIIRDITANRQAEDKLRLQGRIIETMAEGVYLIRASDGIIVYTNPKFEQMFGYEHGELIGRHVAVVNAATEKTPQEVAAEITRVLNKSGEWSGEVYNIRKDGTLFWCYATVSTFEHHEYGKVWISVHTDITERKKAEEIQRENERLILANQAKSDFLAVMSHELRTPLNAIIGFSELLKQNRVGALNEKQETYVGNVLTSGKHLLNLVNGILDLTRIESGKMEMLYEEFSVPVTIDETLELIQTGVEKRNVILKKEIEPQLEFIEADKRKFKQVLFNLLSNAIKFSKPEGGLVTVRAKRTGDMAEFSVSDTGIGIKEEDMGKLFRVFQQVDSGISRKYGGTGLGLAITKQLVELHGGTVRVESRYGEGTTFTFVLPLSANKPVEK